MGQQAQCYSINSGGNSDGCRIKCDNCRCGSGSSAVESVHIDVDDRRREKRPPQIVEEGATYTGQWIGQARDGYGVLAWPDGSRYQGQFRANQQHGTGKFEYDSGDIYSGEWVHGQAHGEGAFLRKDGSKYEGEWISNKQHGRGTEEWPEGAKFRGEYKAGVKTGIGAFVWSDGTMYEGQLLNNELHGWGTFTRIDKGEFEGQWANNQMNGQGTFTWDDGKKYQGQYKDDLKHGTGVFSYADGRQYNGEWEFGKMHGQGVWETPAKLGVARTSRKGEWKRGKFRRWLEPGDGDSIAGRMSEISSVMSNASIPSTLSGRSKPRRDGELHPQAIPESSELRPPGARDRSESPHRGPDAGEQRRSKSESRSAFLIFASEMRDDLYADLGISDNLNVPNSVKAEAIRQMNIMWSEMDALAKAPYQARALEEAKAAETDSNQADL